MTITYTWAITSIKGEDPDTDGDLHTITRAYWELTGSDGTNTSTMNGVTPLNIDMSIGNDPEGGYATVTEAAVITAVQEALGVNLINSFKSTINNALYTKSLPSIVTPTTLPWAV